MASQSPQRVPPYLANVHQACHHCFKSNCPLQRCSKCLRVSYDSSECQKADWKAHKRFCSAHKATDVSVHEDDPPLEPTEDTHLLNDRASRQVHFRLELLEDWLDRPLTIPERNLVVFEPRCLVCSRSDFDVRTGTASSSSTARALQPCPSCKITFFCSEAHREFGKRIHQEIPDPDSSNGLNQCVINSQIFIDLIHKELLQRGQDNEFAWAPERTKPSWEPLMGKDWMNAFIDDLPRDLPVPETFIRLSSDILSFPMTILWGLQSVNEDDAWTKKDTLTIHVIGASQREVQHSSIFEEILHRLPAVKTLKLVLCGPELVDVGIQGEETMDMDTCPACTRRRRKRICVFHPTPYHTFVERTRSRFSTPDLAIAFNSGCGSEEIESWRPTIKLLVDKKIPTVFTSYQRQEAEEDSALFRALDANLLLLGGPNPWGSQVLIVEPSKIRGYYAINGFIAGVFK